MTSSNHKSTYRRSCSSQDSSFICLDDFEREALKILPKNARDYYSSGADDEITLRDNVKAFRRYLIYPRVLRDVSIRQTTTTVLGHRVTFPVCIASTGMHQLADANGELATAKAAASIGTIFTLSTASTFNIEDVAAANDAAALVAGTEAVRFFQLYMSQKPEVTRQLVERAERAGYSAIILTTDTAVLGKRRNDRRNQFQLPSHMKLANLDMFKEGQQMVDVMMSMANPTATWAHIDWLRSITQLPVMVKGILAAEDALEAVRRGVAGIIVSNHGARQLDTVPATIDVLGEVVAAVGGRCEVYLDGGIRTGTDVFKALALGARAVFIGRPILYGLACNGEMGVRQVLQILKDEFDSTLALSGCTSVADINTSYIRHRAQRSML